MGTIVFREATARDADFLVKAVRRAEQVPLGENRCMYECIVGLTGEEVDRFLSEMLSQDGSDHQLTFRTFCVLANEDVPVACCAAWIEAGKGVPSGLTVAMALSRFIGTKRWRERAPTIGALAACAPRRTPLALQLESFYVEPAFRGHGATTQLIEGVAQTLAHAGRLPESAEISLLQENRGAASAYLKSGFEVAWTTPHIDERLRALTGSNGFLQMRRTF